MDETPPPLVVIRGGSYRVTAWVLFAAALLVFGGLWGLVAWDHWTAADPAVARFAVVSALAVAAPLVALGAGLWMNRRARRRNDFDRIVRADGEAVVVAHSCTGRRVEVARGDVAGWALALDAPGADGGSSGPQYRLWLRLRDGRALRSEPVGFADRLRRRLRDAGIEWTEET